MNPYFLATVHLTFGYAPLIFIGTLRIRRSYLVLNPCQLLIDLACVVRRQQNVTETLAFLNVHHLSSEWPVHRPVGDALPVTPSLHRPEPVSHALHDCLATTDRPFKFRLTIFVSSIGGMCRGDAPLS